VKSHYSEFTVFTNTSWLHLLVNYELLKLHKHIKIHDLRICCDAIFFGFQYWCTQFFIWKSSIFS